MVTDDRLMKELRDIGVEIARIVSDAINERRGLRADEKKRLKKLTDRGLTLTWHEEKMR